MPAYLARPDGDVARVGVVVVHELFGVNPDIISVVDDIAHAGYLTIAPEFYHRDAAPGRWLPRDDSGRDEGFSLLHKMTRTQAIDDVRACADLLKTRCGVDEIAMVGFSAGGHLAFLAATQVPVSRVVVLYGGWLTSTDIPLSRPEPTLTLASGITGKLLYLVGESDKLIDEEERGEIASALQAANITHEMVTYPGAQHAFFWPGTPTFDESARNDARRRILALLAEN
ncbi:dienelactone hydrolase family protein [Pseudofrankia sp. BMG5.37]|uniref:dienelactone hydrolase family protein n=1 Tax=Pseudofrankia sp. BMG5.37 TaxID=3050035 RepID=UPI002895CA6B|nr:dienelactone hydrolase family protein [Pseudofrankia sp. BMG5.37]MDT3439733.1 dienelactone hydrolase family protein [Pseudofrankia sp. BMG5.37]